MKLPVLNLPPYPFKLKEENTRTMVFDSIRKKYVVLTPEEWVRQNFLQYLIIEKKVPPGLIAIETGHRLNTLAKRTDVVVHNNAGQPILLVECKAPEIKISQNTFDQAARYNMTLKVKYLVVTNGMNHYCCIMDYLDRTYLFIPDLPDYHQF